VCGVTFDYDAELRRYHPLLLEASDVRPEEKVLDIGCGAGQSTRDAARAAVDGSALGVDVSAPMLELARERSRQEGVHNVAFELADAARQPFPTNHFDVVISRFGTMFFTDPIEAFTNITRAVRPAGRLAMLVWQAGEHQEWVTTINRALTGDETPPAGASAFSLADPTVVRGVLDAAGYTSVDLTDLREPVYYGPDATSAFEAILELRMTDRIAGLGYADRERALDRLRATLSDRETEDGVWFDTRVWLVTAVVR
jgi:SAM-dependent methyltransferase